MFLKNYLSNEGSYLMNEANEENSQLCFASIILMVLIIKPAVFSTGSMKIAPAKNKPTCLPHCGSVLHGYLAVLSSSRSWSHLDDSWPPFSHLSILPPSLLF